MTTHVDPFAFVDFNQNPQRPGEQPPAPGPQVNMPPQPGTVGPTTAMPSPGKPGVLPPDISPGLDPEEAYGRANRYLSSLLANPGSYTDDNQYSPTYGQIKEDPTWANQVTAAQKMVDTTLGSYKDKVTQERADAQRAEQRANQLADRAASSAASAAARAASQAASLALAQTNHKLRLIEQEQSHQQDLKEIAVRGDVDLARQQDQQGFLSGERVAGQEFQLGKLGKEQDFTRGERVAGQDFQLDKLGKEQDFNARENAADREIRRTQNEIAAGNLNLSTALGKLKAWLDAVPYSLPAGAEYAPGYQPGGGVQEGARLAGVSYNPANYRANTVPFDPAAVVRQTMGR